MSDAIGRLILISNVYPTRTKLDEIINGYQLIVPVHIVI